MSKKIRRVLKRADDKFTKLIFGWATPDLPTDENIVVICANRGQSLPVNKGDSTVKPIDKRTGPERMFADVDFRSKVIVSIDREISVDDIESKLKQAMGAKTTLVLDFRRMKYDTKTEEIFGKLVDKYGPRLFYYIDIRSKNNLEERVLDYMIGRLESKGEL